MNFTELKDDILKFYPDAKVQDDYFKVFVVNNSKLEKLIIQHHSIEPSPT